jgi:hypothetical protein
MVPLDQVHFNHDWKPRDLNSVLYLYIPGGCDEVTHRVACVTRLSACVPTWLSAPVLIGQRLVGKGWPLPRPPVASPFGPSYGTMQHRRCSHFRMQRVYIPYRAALSKEAVQRVRASHPSPVVVRRSAAVP